MNECCFMTHSDTQWIMQGLTNVAIGWHSWSVQDTNVQLVCTKQSCTDFKQSFDSATLSWTKFLRGNTVNGEKQTDLGLHLNHSI